MKSLGYYNGSVGPLEEMMIPMNDRVCFFGDGVYEATNSRNGVIFALDEHVDRMFSSAGLLRMEIPMTKDEMKDLLNGLTTKVDAGDTQVYWQITRGTADRNHAFPKDVPANVWVTIRPSKLKDMTKKVKLITTEDTRFLHCNIKTLNLIPNIMAAQKAAEADADECVFHRGQVVTEGSHSNAHIIKDGVLKTHPTNNLILPGIARAHIIATCYTLNIPVDETPFTLDEMMAADEVLISSSSGLCLQAEAINDILVGGKADALVKALQAHLQKEFIEYTSRGVAP